MRENDLSRWSAFGGALKRPPAPTPSKVPRPPGSLSAAEVRAVKAATEALHGLSGEKAANAAYTILCDHPRVTAEHLEVLSNMLGRAAHERSRDDA